jgi:MraZ protein
VQRRLLAPAQEVEVDRLGRILVPQSLREYAKLSKECIILGMPHHIEIWDTTVYEAYLEATDPSFQTVTTSFAGISPRPEETP